MGSRLERTVFLSAVVPPTGKRFVDALGFPGGRILRILLWLRPRELRPSERMIRSELCNDLREADAAEVVDRYEAEWPGLYLSPVQDARGLPDPVYVRLTRDRSVPPALQERAIANLRRPDVVDLDAGHLAMLSRPEELAELVMRAIDAT